MTLRETLLIAHKGSRSQIARQPEIGEVVLIKEDNKPCRTWKIAQIKLAQMEKFAQLVVQLPNKHLLTRSINHLYPLEIGSTYTTATTS